MNDTTRKIIEIQLTDLKNRIIENHLRAGQKASGKTIESLQVKNEDENSIGLFGRSFISTLETGRKSGKVPYGFYSIILKWIEDKGINVENPKTMAYFTAKKIASEGTKLFRDGGRSDIYSNEIEKTIRSIETEIGRAAIESITNIKINK